MLCYTADGAFAEKVAAPEGDVWRIPDEMPFEDAAAFGLVYLTAHISLVENCHAQPGERVLVTGASGGVGLAMVQYGAALGLRIIAGVTSPEKAALAREHGAEATVDLAADDLHESLRSQIHAIVPEGVDLVMDQVGGDVFDAALRCIRPCGRIAIVGFAGGRINPIKPTYLLNKQITVIGSPLGKIRPDWQAVKDRAMAALLAQYAAGRLRPLITETVPLAEWKTRLWPLQAPRGGGQDRHGPVSPPSAALERVPLDTFLAGLDDEAAARARVAAAEIDRLARIGDRMEGIERRYLSWAAAGAVLFLLGLWMLVDPQDPPGRAAARPAAGGAARHRPRLCPRGRAAHARRPRGREARTARTSCRMAASTFPRRARAAAVVRVDWTPPVPPPPISKVPRDPRKRDYRPGRIW